MTYTGGEYSLESLFEQLKQQVKEENLRSFDQYKDIVDSIVEEKKSYGFFAEDEDTEQIKRDLELRWPEIEDRLQLS